MILQSRNDHMKPGFKEDSQEWKIVVPLYPDSSRSSQWFFEKLEVSI